MEIPNPISCVAECVSRQRGWPWSYPRVSPGTSGWSSSPSRLQLAFWVALLVPVILLWLSLYHSFQLGAYIDDSFYVILAKSLLSSKYGMINLPHPPVTAPFPIGYPLLLAPLVCLFPNDTDVLKVLSLLATLLNAALLFWGWRYLGRTRSYWWGLGVAALYLFSPLTIDHTRMVMSEPVFMTCSLAALILAERIARGTSHRWESLALSVALFEVISIRAVGWLLFFTVCAYLLFRLGSRAREKVALVLIGMLTWSIMILLVTGAGAENLFPLRYVTDGLDTMTQAVGSQEVAPAFQVLGVHVPLWRLDMILANLNDRIPWLVVPIYGNRVLALTQQVGISSLLPVFGLAVFSLIAVGYLRWFAEAGLALMPLFSILYIGLLLVWIYSGTRLLYPIEPQLEFAFLLGVESLILQIGRFFKQVTLDLRFRNAILVVFTVCLLTLSLYKGFRLDNSRWHVGDLQVRTNWLTSNTDSSAIIMSEQPEIDFLFGGRRTVPFPTSTHSSQQLEDYLAQNDISYIVVAPDMTWTPSYEPSYSKATATLLPIIETLVGRNQLGLVYSSDQDLIRVFKKSP